ncbi:hypothetical protein BG003_010006 [Podila horticola]|nr:hypothetical protein BG003_010006 [Podila horticola]
MPLSKNPASPSVVPSEGSLAITLAPLAVDPSGTYNILLLGETQFVAPSGKVSSLNAIMDAVILANWIKILPFSFLYTLIDALRR